MTPIRTELRVDYVGTYYAYVYSDGHVETDPPGRPLYKEDVQRLRRKQLANVNATRQVAAERLRVSGSRDDSALVGTSDQLESYRQTQAALRTLAGTNAATATDLLNLETSADLGGPLVGDEAITKDRIGVPTVGGQFPETPVRPPILEGMR